MGTVYNKWHETELERWLTDHNVPYPTTADRKDLENLVKKNWETKVSSPYSDWEPSQLHSYLKSKGHNVKQGTESSKDSLISQVKSYWTDSAETASDSYKSVKDWIFDRCSVRLCGESIAQWLTFRLRSWSDSQLKAFLDKHGVAAPQPRKRDSLLATVRDNYESIAQKTKQTIHYPGDWLYETWTESDLKEFLDERGIPVPQPTTRDKLIASVRRNSRLASLNVKQSASSASASASAAQASLSDALLDAWSESQIKEWADKHGIKVPQGANRHELVALARKHRDSLLDVSPISSASSAYHAATTKAGNEYSRATDGASAKTGDAFDAVLGTWSETRLKAFLDARGVPVPQHGKRDELVAAARLHQHKAASGWSAWTFDTWTTENLRYVQPEREKRYL